MQTLNPFPCAPLSAVPNCWMYSWSSEHIFVYWVSGFCWWSIAVVKYFNLHVEVWSTVPAMGREERKGWEIADEWQVSQRNWFVFTKCCGGSRLKSVFLRPSSSPGNILAHDSGEIKYSSTPFGIQVWTRYLFVRRGAADGILNFKLVLSLVTLVLISKWCSPWVVLPPRLEGTLEMLARMHLLAGACICYLVLFWPPFRLVLSNDWVTRCPPSKSKAYLTRIKAFVRKCTVNIENPNFVCHTCSCCLCGNLGKS